MVIMAFSLGALAVATTLVMVALSDTITYFYSPSDLAAEPPEAGVPIRVGVLVGENSVVRSEGLNVAFSVTDQVETLDIQYEGVLPDLFREGQGIVASGRLTEGGVFVADNILAKHDETYMPPEVADALKRAEHWKNQSADSPGY